MSILLAIVTGSVLGYIIERGDFCFHSTLRGLFRTPPRLNLFRAYLVTLLIAIPAVQVMIAQGWIEPWIAPFAWQANLVGGIIFGVGMVVASTCVTGLFYKLGHGMLGTLVGLLAWGIGDVLTYKGPLRFVREALNSTVIDVDGQVATLPTLLHSSNSTIRLAIMGMLVVIYLWSVRRNLRSQSQVSDEAQPYWGWLKLGIVTGVFISLAWLLAQAGGSNYTFGTSYVPTSLFELVVNGVDIQWWIPASLLSIIIGALIAAVHAGTLWVRGETFPRYLELAAGGLLMGIGAAISGGCNLGHGLVGVPLLSLGSIATTVSMAIGVFIAHRVTVQLSQTSS